jgi:hypothetical protein
MAKAAKQKTAAKPKSKKAQYERFRETARALGVDDENSGQAFEEAFRKIVPPKRAKPRG